MDANWERRNILKQALKIALEEYDKAKRSNDPYDCRFACGNMHLIRGAAWIKYGINSRLSRWARRKVAELRELERQKKTLAF